MMQSILFLAVFFGTSILAFDTTVYSNSQNLMGENYTIYWKIQGDSIQIGLDVQTQGWIGFGIGEPTSGSMPGADVVIASMISGVPNLSDRYTLAKATPLVDDHQDWTLISMTRSSQRTMVEMSRVLLVNNTQDRSIVAGPNRIIFSHGDTDSFSYHGINRGATVISFYGASVAPLPTTLPSWTLLSTNFTIPAQVTTYAFTSFVLPTKGGPYHMVAFEPIIDSDAVHHFILHYCPSNTTWFRSFLNRTSTGTASIDNGYCVGQVWGWAPGMGALTLPDNVGFKVGDHPDDFKYMTLEIHLNNPASRSDLGRISSGVKIYYTNQLRQYDAAVLALGDPFVLTPSIIPPGLDKWEVEYSCPEMATLNNMNQSITVFSSNHHMHATGRQMWTSHWRNFTEISETNRVDFFDFNFQQSTPVNFTIQPGDRFNTHCVFDTTPRSGNTKFGMGSSDEMCIEFLAYYPRLPNTPATCGFAYSQQYNINVSVWDVNPVTSPNPLVRDPMGGATIVFGSSQTSTSQNTETAQTTQPSDGTSSPQVDAESHSGANVMTYGIMTILVMFMWM